MKDYFIPYSGKKPKVFNVNGHRFILLSESKEGLENSLTEMGADRVREVKAGATDQEQTDTLHRLAKTIKASVVVAPEDIELDQVLTNLESQLPWIH